MTKFRVKAFRHQRLGLGSDAKGLPQLNPGNHPEHEANNCHPDPNKVSNVPLPKGQYERRKTQDESYIDPIKDPQQLPQRTKVESSSLLRAPSSYHAPRIVRRKGTISAHFPRCGLCKPNAPNSPLVVQCNPLRRSG